MAENQVTQLSVEVATEQPNITNVTQVSMEVAYTSDPVSHVTQVSVEVALLPSSTRADSYFMVMGV